MIKSQGIISANFGGDDKLVMASPLDKVRYIASDERTCREVVKLIGEAIGKPDLQWLTITDEQAKNNRLKRGMAPAIVDLLVELGAAIHSGLLRSDYEKHKPALGKLKIQEFIKEFVTAYNHN